MSLPLFCLLWLMLTFVSAASAQALEARPEVIASHYPLAYFAQRIAGTQANVSFLVPEGIDPAWWRPAPRDVTRLQKADLLLFNGAGYESWLSRVSVSRIRQTDTTAAFADRLIPIEQAVTHSHGGSGPHTHAGTAFTTWLDFSQARLQARAVAEALARKQPQLKSRFAEHLAALEDDLDRLDASLLSVTRTKPARPLMASHPVYQYLARRYGLDLVSVHWEPGDLPPASEWSALTRTLEKHPARIMIWESQPRVETAERLTRLGLTSVVFDPCANRPAQGDFLTVMQNNITHLKTALEAKQAHD